MTKQQTREIVERLLHEMEEEDIGISLFTTYYKVQEELLFFKEFDRERILKILEKLARDSQRHKTILEKVINHLGKSTHET